MNEVLKNNTTYVALLRGINVSGHNLIKMADLKKVLSPLGLENVRSYLQSGNLVFTTDQKDGQKLELLISETIKTSFDMDIPVMIIQKDRFLEIFKDNPFMDAPDKDTRFLYYIHLMGVPDGKLFNAILEDQQMTEEFYLSGEVIYAYYTNGYGRSKRNNNFFERKLKIPATARNYNTMKKLCAMITDAL